MKKFKKITAVLLSGIMAFGVFTAFPLSAGAAETTTEETGETYTSSDGAYKYEVLDDDTAEITGYIGPDTETLEVPSTIDGYAVTSIIGGDGFAFCIRIDPKSVIIPDGVTNIGYCAFAYCSSITSVSIPDSVTSIARSAFNSCRGLTSITIQDGVTSIEDNTFCGCSSLASVTLGSSVNMIGYYAFRYCRSLTSITISDSVTFIGESAFEECTALEDVVIGSGVTTIGENAFSGCDNFKRLTISDSVTDVQLNWCKGVEEVIIADGSKTVTANMIPTTIKTVSIPDSVTSIGSYAFSGSGDLTSITIPDSVTDICDYAFVNCENLTSITIPDSVKTIGECAFGYKWSNTSYVKMDNFTIYGYTGSASEAYANENGFAFVSIGESANPIVTEPTEDAMSAAPTSAAAATDPTTPVVTTPTVTDPTEPTTTEPATTEPAEVKLGDVNGDGTIDISDATIIQKGVAQIVDFTDEQKLAADVNGDGTVDISDATMVQKFVAKIITAFTAAE